MFLVDICSVRINSRGFQQMVVTWDLISTYLTICPNHSDLQKYYNSSGNPIRSREKNLILFWTFQFSERNDFLEREMSKLTAVFVSCCSEFIHCFLSKPNWFKDFIFFKMYTFFDDMSVVWQFFQLIFAAYKLTRFLATGSHVGFLPNNMT